MNRVAGYCAVTLLMAGLVFSQSLGDVARQNRQAKQLNKKTAAHVYTNDEIPSVTVVRAEPAQTSAEAQAPNASEGAASAEQKAADGQAATSDDKGAEQGKAAVHDQVKKLNDSYRATIDEAQKTVDMLERELNVAQREHQIQTAVYYTDAGTRLRDPKDWTEKQKQFQDEMAAKKKALDEAKEKLQDLKEQARRSDAETATAQ